MTTIRSFPVALALLTSALATPPQGAVTTVVPGRDYEEQKLLTPGFADTWKLDVDADEMLWCRVDSSAFDPVLDFLDDQGTVLGTDDGASTHSELWLRAPRKGAMQFRVRPFQGSGGGFYSYRLHRFRTEPLGTNAEASHTFGREQWWHYRIAIEKGDVLVPTTLGDGRVTCMLDAMRNPIAETLGGYRAPATGDYFVRVEGPEGKKCQTLTQLARRNDLSLDAPREERAAPFGLDHWRVVVRSGEAFVVDVLMGDVPLANDLVDVAPTRDGPAFVGTGHFDKGGQVRRYYFARRDATLELRLRNTNSTAASYHVAVRRPDRELAVGKRTSGRLEVGDGAQYRLALTSGQLLRVSLDSTAFDGWLDLLDVHGNVFAKADDRAPLDRNPSHTFLVPATGTYRVLVRSAGSGIGGGEFTVLVEPLEVPLLQPDGKATVKLGAGETTYLHLDL